MELLVAVVVLAVLVSVGAVWLKSRGSVGGGISETPYTQAPALFSPAERSFLGVLDQAVGDEYRVFGKVRVADVVNVQPMADRKAWQRAFNRIKGKHFDFVLCAKDDLSVIAVVELDDESHQKGKRQARDRFLADVCEAASLPLIQVPAKHAYSVTDLRMELASVPGVAPGNAAPPPEAYEEDRTLSETTTSARATAEEDEIKEARAEASESPRCPRCGAQMVRREAKSGANAGKAFWGCSFFPKCGGTLEISG